MRDSWFTVARKFGRPDLFAKVHQFSAHKVSGAASKQLGRGRDFMLSYPLLANPITRLQHARFRAGAAARTANDVDKMRLTLCHSC